MLHGSRPAAPKTRRTTVITTDPALATHELRVELTVLGDGTAIHIGLFATTLDGQWFLLDDWDATTPKQQGYAAAQLSQMVEDWTIFGGHPLPA